MKDQIDQSTTFMREIHYAEKKLLLGVGAKLEWLNKN